MTPKIMDYIELCPQLAKYTTKEKWLKHSTVDEKFQIQILPVASQVKCFVYPFSPWESSL